MGKKLESNIFAEVRQIKFFIKICYHSLKVDAAQAIFTLVLRTFRIIRLVPMFEGRLSQSPRM